MIDWFTTVQVAVAVLAGLLCLVARLRRAQAQRPQPRRASPSSSCC